MILLIHQFCTKATRLVLIGYFMVCITEGKKTHFLYKFHKVIYTFLLLMFLMGCMLAFSVIFYFRLLLSLSMYLPVTVLFVH